LDAPAGCPACGSMLIEILVRSGRPLALAPAPS
jgi:hypothetical protein